MLNRYEPISLKETSSIRLMDRFDTKYLIPLSLLSEILSGVSQQYLVMTEKERCIFDYDSLYFDTPDYEMFHSHHNRQAHRYKLRLREYCGFDLVFAEIKEKYKGKTKKVRYQAAGYPDINACMEDAAMKDRILSIWAEQTPFQKERIDAVLFSHFRRFTLVHRSRKERITIDTDMRFSFDGISAGIPNIAVIEIKHSRAVAKLEMSSILRANGVYPSGFSKYCHGLMKIHPDLKYNNFKRTQQKLARYAHE